MKEKNIKNKSTLHQGFLNLEIMMDDILGIIVVVISFTVSTFSGIVTHPLNDEIVNVQALVIQSHDMLKTQGKNIYLSMV